MSGLPGNRRLAGALVVLCFVVALGTVVFGEAAGTLLGSDQVLNGLYLLAYLLPVLGLSLIGVVAWTAWRRSLQDDRTDEFVDGPRWGHEQELVGRDLERRLENAAADWYRCEGTYSIADIRERLEKSAVRALKASTGFDDDQSRAALEEGVWTADPVAAAFLSPRRGQPLAERLRGALDPGQAFHRRVDRTVAAIEALEDDEISLANPDPDAEPSRTKTDRKARSNRDRKDSQSAGKERTTEEVIADD